MPTLNKLEYLDETKQEIKGALNTNFNSGITDNDTFRSYVDKIKNIYTNWPRVTGENTELTLSPTRKGKMEIELSPSEMKQATTTGKNLLKIKNTTDRGITTKINDDGSVNVNGTATDTLAYLDTGETTNLPIGTYTLSLQSALSVNVRAFLYNSGTQIEAITIGAGQTSASITTTQVATEYSVIIYGLTAGNSYNATLKLQLEQGSTSTSWEEYTGGQPSPNPQYPQQIHTVSGENSVIINNKNLYNSNFRNNNSINSTRCTATEANGIYTLNATSNDMYIWGVLSSGSSYVLGVGPIFEFKENVYSVTITNELFKTNYVTFYDENKISLGYVSKTSNIFTINKNEKTNAKYFTIRIGYGQSVSGQTYSTSVQLEKGSIATNYMKYQEQTYPISLGYLEYCKIGDYEDMFFKNVVGSEYYDSTLELDKWYLKKNVDKEIYDGTETWAKSSSFANSYYSNLPNSKSIGENDTTIYVFCNNFIRTYKNNLTNLDYACALSVRNNIVIKNKDISTVDDFKDFLTTHNAIVYYVQETPTYTLLNNTLQTQLDNLSKAISYQDQTNVSQTNDDLGFIISASALKKGGN